MKNLILKWLGLDTVMALVDLNRQSIDASTEAINNLNRDFNSRAPCKICGHHRYNKKPQRYGEIERARKRRNKANTAL